jgi:SAM-dependent methyltransferase
MIVEAKAHEQLSPFHITYLQGDARTLQLHQSFDLVTAFYLLNYADTASDLATMIETCIQHLKPSGRCVTIVPNPAFEPGLNDTEPYGFTLDALETQPQGQRVRMRFSGEDPLELEFMQWSLKILEGLFLEKGFTQIQWRPFEVTPDGWEAMGEAFWTSALQNPKSLLLSAIRGS